MRSIWLIAFMVAKLGKHVSKVGSYNVWPVTKIFSCFLAAKFVSATYVYRAAKLGNICYHNNVSLFSQASRFPVVADLFWWTCCTTHLLPFIIVSIAKFSIVIGSQRAYLSRNRRAITWVPNYSCPWTFCNPDTCNWIPTWFSRQLRALHWLP